MQSGLLHGKFVDPPRIVVFGVEDDYIYLTANTAEFSLKNYPELGDMLQQLNESKQTNLIRVSLLIVSLGMSITDMVLPEYCHQCLPA